MKAGVLRGNIANRPFYNERLVTLVLAAVAALVLALTAFNATRLVALSAERAALRTKIEADTAAAERVKKEAGALRQTADVSSLRLLAGSSQLANLLIDQRTFSWTAFFGLVEDTLPDDVRVNAVAPEIDKGRIVVTLLVVGKRQQDINAFMKALENTGAFYDVLVTAEDRTDDNLYRDTIRAGYTPPKAPVQPPKAPAEPAKPGTADAPAAGRGR